MSSPTLSSVNSSSHNTYPSPPTSPMTNYLYNNTLAFPNCCTFSLFFFGLLSFSRPVYNKNLQKKNQLVSLSYPHSAPCTLVTHSLILSIISLLPSQEG